MRDQQQISSGVSFTHTIRLQGPDIMEIPSSWKPNPFGWSKPAGWILTALASGGNSVSSTGSLIAEIGCESFRHVPIFFSDACWS
jgi:hypothetical protein